LPLRVASRPCAETSAVLTQLCATSLAAEAISVTAVTICSTALD